MSDYLNYPEHTVKRNGIKVSWLNFANKELAELGASIAKYNAVIAVSRGYDFGYNYPSEITPEEDGTYTVCVP